MLARRIPLEENVMSTPVNWGILSTAKINRAVIPPLQASQRARLLGVASRSAERAAAYAAEQGIPRSYGSYEALLADPEIHIVYNSLPNDQHAAWTIRACEAGKHVLCEKPLALSTAEVDRVARAAEANGVFVLEAFMYRFTPQTEKVIELVRSGAIGDLHYLRGTFSFLLTRPGNYRWRPEQGGGGLWDVGCYPINYARLLTGKPPKQVIGSQVTGPSGIDLLFSGTLIYDGEIHAQISSAVIVPYHTHFEARGSQATLLVNDPYKPNEGRGIVLKTDEGEERFTFPTGDLYTGEVEHLTECALTGRPPSLSLQESRENIATIVALFESARTGRPVDL
jgi:predicted dehydrogenase